MDHEMPEEELVRARQLASAIADGASKFGLHATESATGLDYEGRTTIVMDFRIGDLAFTDQVQNPTADAANDALRSLDTEVTRDAGLNAFLETQRKLDGEDAVDG